MQVNQRPYRDARRADLHSGAGDRVQHPSRHNRNHAGCRLDVDDPTGDALLATVLPDTTPVERVPAIMDLDLLPDTGRMTGRLLLAESH